MGAVGKQMHCMQLGHCLLAYSAVYQRQLNDVHTRSCCMHRRAPLICKCVAVSGAASKLQPHSPARGSVPSREDSTEMPGGRYGISRVRMFLPDWNCST